MFLMDPWITGRRGAKVEKKLLTIEKKRSMKEIFCPSWCGTYRGSVAWSVCSPMLEMLSSWSGMLRPMGVRMMGSFGTLKTFDLNHPEFSNDPRNVRFAFKYRRNESFLWDNEPTQYLANDFKHIQHSFMVVPQEKVFDADNPCF
jgi:hypothetical protein